MLCYSINWRKYSVGIIEEQCAHRCAHPKHEKICDLELEKHPGEVCRYQHSPRMRKQICNIISKFQDRRNQKSLHLHSTHSQSIS